MIFYHANLAMDLVQTVDQNPLRSCVKMSDGLNLCHRIATNRPTPKVF